jgi:phage baseplate assembly protein W
MSGISPKLPLIANSEDGHYGLTKTFLEATKQNFKHLLLTIPGEKVFDVNFGVGLSQFLFEQDPYFVKGEISAKIQEQLDLYLPHVLLLDLQFQNQENFDAIAGNLLSLRLIYKLQPFNQQDFLDITIE